MSIGIDDNKESFPLPLNPTNLAKSIKSIQHTANYIQACLSITCLITQNINYSIHIKIRWMVTRMTMRGVTCITKKHTSVYNMY